MNFDNIKNYDKNELTLINLLDADLNIVTKRIESDIVLYQNLEDNRLKLDCINETGNMALKNLISQA